MSRTSQNGGSARPQSCPSYGLAGAWRRLAVDSEGRIYFIDMYTGLLGRVDSMKGDGLVVFGGKGTGKGQFL